MIQGSLSEKLTVDPAPKHRLPSLSTQKSAVQAGLLLSYSADLAERGHELARYLDKILKGTLPGDLPVQQPTRYELAINLKTAKALGLTVSTVLLLARADQVIE
jgi:putative ABC transport system substrate-binding protein